MLSHQPSVLRLRIVALAGALGSAMTPLATHGCGDADDPGHADLGAAEAYSSGVDETTFAFTDWSASNTSSTCIATGAGSCTTVGTEPSAGNPGSNVICEGNSNAAGCANGFSGCVFERTDASYTPSLDGRVCRIDFQMDSRTVSGTDIASHHLTVSQGATSVFDPAGSFDIDTTYQTRAGSFTLAELDAAGIDRSSSTPLTLGARTADCAPDNPAPITWRMDNLVVTIVKDLNDDGVCDDLQASVCSNGVVEAGEVCDDGNAMSGDGCSGSCLFVDDLPNGSDCSAAGNASCSSGICDATEAPNTCELANACGNGAVEAVEACDDGNAIPGDGCNASCLFEVDAGPCTEGAQCASGVCDTINDNVCELPDVCGNGVLEAGESCDDGNAASGDGCAEDCTLENAWRGGGGCSVRSHGSKQTSRFFIALLAFGVALRRRSASPVHGLPERRDS